MTNGLNLVLSWPHPILNPNDRSHWARKKDAKREAREEAFIVAKNTGTELDPAKRYTMEMLFCPPDRRARDLDNLLASEKFAIDGMCRALGIDDKMIRPVPDWGPMVDGGQVEISIKVIEPNSTLKKLDSTC